MNKRRSKNKNIIIAGISAVFAVIPIVLFCIFSGRVNTGKPKNTWRTNISKTDENKNKTAARKKSKETKKVQKTKKTTKPKKPEITADITNLCTRLSWTPVKGVNTYSVYRKMEDSGWERIVTVHKTSYTDTYYKTFSQAEKRRYFTWGKYFIDMSSHTISYNVHAEINYKDSNPQSKAVYGKDGYFKLNAPIIVEARSYNKNIMLTFSNVPCASYYNVYCAKLDTSGKYTYKKLKTIPQTVSQFTNCSIKPAEGYDYFVVTAFGKRNGETVKAKSDSFTLKNSKFSNKKILFIGDSITYGTPYYAVSGRKVYSYPWRIHELTGAYCNNTAVGGATLADNPQTRSARNRVIINVVPQIKTGYGTGLTFKDYDAIVICVGTNDYTDGIRLGSLDSTDKTTYCGAMNILLRTIADANTARVKEGKKPLTVVMPDLFYSDNYHVPSVPESRYDTKNGFGNTLRDFNDAKNNIAEKYQKKGLNIIRFKTDSIVNKKNCAYATVDNLHMTKYVYEKIGDALADVIVNDLEK
ncbi:MAG: SGNH/GDSL hydrolase family protein [Lachnospiraceae bacterium]|nr:MAG: SGNH/GDSL hydrolase family protein [Lachnospiraceae bacterium]